MGLLQTMRRQKAAYWAPLANPEGQDQYDRYGQRRYAEPVEIRCRWEDSTEEFLDAQQEKVLSNATVYVDRDVAVGGKIRLGALTTLTFADDPAENDGVYEIRRYEKTPNMRVSDYLRKVFV